MLFNLFFYTLYRMTCMQRGNGKGMRECHLCCYVVLDPYLHFSLPEE